MNIFVTSDTHFNHKNIIKYCNRPYKDVEEMNEAIINNWNNLITNDDVIYHLGDFGFGTKEELKQIFNRLNGQKYLIMGNHDKKVGRNYYLELGFLNVYRKEYQLDNYILTHEPIEVESDKINIYGHIHNSDIDPIFDDPNHKCICLERTRYKPLLLMRKK